MRARVAVPPTLALALALTAGCARELPPEGIRVVGLPAPAAVLHDPAADVYLVSHRGSGVAASGPGGIARVSAAGRLLDLRWIDGARDGTTLRAPRGMALHGELLWVADDDAVRRFDRRSGAPRGEVVIPGAVGLQGVAVAPDGTVWVTGRRPDAAGAADDAAAGDGIWTIAADGTVTALAAGGDLGGPDGIVAPASGAFVVGARNGVWYQLDRAGRRTELMRVAGAGLSGLVKAADGLWLATGASAGTVYRFDTSGTAQPLVTGLAAPAHLDVDATRRRLLVALRGADAVLIRPL